LKQWLELSLNDKVPPSLLLLTRALYLPEEFSFAQRLRTILNSLPEELGEETKQKLTELEGGSIDHKERLALIRRVEEGLKKERQAADEAAKKRAEEKKTDEKKAEEEKQKSAETIAAEVTTKQTEKEKSTEKPAKSLDEVIIAAQSAVKELHVSVGLL
jgi:LETM1 and EF-hand domain-containing protein 1